MKQARQWDLGLPLCIFLLFTGSDRAEYNYKLITSRPPRTLGRTAESISPRVGSTAARRIARRRWRLCYAPHTGVLEPSDLRRGEGKRQVAAAARSRAAANPGCRGIAKFLASRAQATPSREHTDERVTQRRGIAVAAPPHQSRACGPRRARRS